MPQPSLRDSHVDQLLTSMSVSYQQDTNEYISDKIFPIVYVPKQSDRYLVYDKSYWFRTQAAERAPGTESAGGGYVFDNTNTYYAKVIAHHKDLDAQTEANSDSILKPRETATRFVTNQLLIRREIDWMSKFMTTGVWKGIGNSDYAPPVKWDSAGSDPIKEVDKLSSAIKSQSAKRPNVLVFTDDVFNVVKNHPMILDRIKYTQRAIVTEELLASLFNVKTVLKAEQVLCVDPESATPFKANSGTPPTFQFMKNNAALLVYAAPNAAIDEASGGYTFAWSGLYNNGSKSYSSTISTIPMPTLKSDRIEGEMSYDHKIVCPDVGVFLNQIITPS